jgi:hypothetical protein
MTLGRLGSTIFSGILKRTAITASVISSASLAFCFSDLPGKKLYDDDPAGRASSKDGTGL